MAAGGQSGYRDAEAGGSLERETACSGEGQNRDRRVTP